MIHFYYSDFWSICQSKTRDNLFIIHPSLNTCVHENVFLYAFHHQDAMIEEIEQSLYTGNLIEKHIETMSQDNKSGISLRKLYSMNVNILKLPP